MLAIGCFFPVVLAVVGGIAGAWLGTGHGALGAVIGFAIGVVLMLGMVWGWERIRNRGAIE